MGLNKGEGMYKLILTFKRKSGLDMEQMKNLYENGHVPLARRILPPMDIYRRNYIVEDPAFYKEIGYTTWEGADKRPFDCVTEAIFATREHALALLKARLSDELREEMMQDEAGFIEPGSLKFHVVDVHQCSTPWRKS
jgi:hypothetical protein